MFKKISLVLATLVLSLSLCAQNVTGGVKGQIIDRATKEAVYKADLKLYSGAEQIATTQSDAEGDFKISNLKDGIYKLVVDASGYLKMTVNVTVNDGYVKNMFKLSMTPSRKLDLEDDNFAEFDIDDSGFSDSPTLLFGSNDVFNNVTSYNFSSVRFKTRGYASESQDVYFAGIKMNDAVTGYSPWSLWSGLNEATRTKDIVNGMEMSDYGFGGYNGLTNIMGNAGAVRPGTRFSVLTNSAWYRLRLMGSYSSGELDNGWSYAVNVSARLGDNDLVKGVYYRSFGYFASAEKNFDDINRLSFTFFAAPANRGAQNGSTQEVYDLMGDNKYNSNWGYQNGKIRNARVRDTHEPIAIIKYDYTPSTDFNASATVLYRFGKNGYSALDWYDAPDPRPDYYRNLPSYFYNANPDLDRNNMSKYMWAKEAWENDFDDIAHVNWDRLNNVNRLSQTPYGNRSKYVLEQRRVDQNDLNFATTAKWKAAKWLTFNGGLNAKINRSEYYKKLHDLLGGDYYVNIDQFAERDFSSSEAKTQNDLDYYIRNGEAQRIGKGDKYGYDYYAQVRNANAWLRASFAKGDFSGHVAGQVGRNIFWRDGLVRKGLFAGTYEDGHDIIVNGENLTLRDPKTNEVISSYGKSKKQKFTTFAFKGALSYVISNHQRVYGNIGYFSEAPNFKQSFVSPRTRNTVIGNLQNMKVFSTDLNYQYSGHGVDVRLTGYYTTIHDQSYNRSFYDDIQHSFTNFAMSGINERHIGMELGFKVPTPINGLSVKGALSYGEYVYTSNPYMTQTVDNSAVNVIDNELLPYWKAHPVFKQKNGEYIQDAQGNYEVDHFQKHYVPSTPQLAGSLGLSFFKNYWFIDAGVSYFDKSYLDMNPLYRTDAATAGQDHRVTPAEVEYMAAQEKFEDAFMVNASIGKSWYIDWKYQLGFSLSINNILNNEKIRTGGYEQARVVSKTLSKERFYRFDPKYFYMGGTNYMLNVYFKF